MEVPPPGGEVSKKFGPLVSNFTAKAGLLNFSEVRGDFFKISNLENFTWVLIKPNFSHLFMCLLGKRNIMGQKWG